MHWCAGTDVINHNTITVFARCGVPNTWDPGKGCEAYKLALHGVGDQQRSRHLRSLQLDTPYLTFILLMSFPYPNTPWISDEGGGANSGGDGVGLGQVSAHSDDNHSCR